MTKPDFANEPTLPSIPKKDREEKIPTQIGPYRIECLLDRGGMSVLYLGTHDDTLEPITIKVLSPECLANPEMVARFLKEAEIIALNDHPNIVKLYNQGEWEGGLYIAMEFIHGISLKQYLLRNLISLKHALELTLQIALALCHFHTHGIIHRDLKPENILITESGGIKVIDFGIAQLLSEVEDAATHHRRIMGTPVYMSPEQKENPALASYPSDIYSLGIIAYELALGKLSHGQIHLSILPKGLQKILTKTLQPDPKNRYQDIVDFIADISEYLHSPALIRENKELDPLSDLSESLHQAHQSLQPITLPHWPSVDLGFTSYKSLGSTNLYYDFFNLPEGAYGIIIGQPCVKGAAGVLNISVLRGMARSLCQFTKSPEELATALNALILDDPMHPEFAFSYLIISPKENLFRYLSCGCGNLWNLTKDDSIPKKLASAQTIIGRNRYETFSEIVQPWNVGDKLFYYTSLRSKPEYLDTPLFLDEDINAMLLETFKETAQRQVELIKRKGKIALTKQTDETSLVVFSISRL